MTLRRVRLLLSCIVFAPALAFTLWPTTPSAPPRIAEKRAALAETTASEKLEQAPASWTLAVAAAGLLLGVLCSPQATFASGQPLQSLSMYHQPVQKPGQWNLQQRLEHNLKELQDPELASEKERHAQAIQAGLDARPKEIRVARAMAHVKEIAKLPLADPNIYSSYVSNFKEVPM
eukprot:TRINITY_DN737_c0_g1_i1.p1 TRINITY_DN737_c0_g1~~TRINITY_DN737_c0_g1_i1.p1  ORF type:complete len:176 (+),score=50.10 TRINITY_DN737_c0_g1_i1:73-600(+)